MTAVLTAPTGAQTAQNAPGVQVPPTGPETPASDTRGALIDGRQRRPTVSVTVDGTDRLTLCADPCAVEYLMSCGVAGRTAGRAKAGADVRVAWSGLKHRLDWRRRTSNGGFCDQCGDAWRVTVTPRMAAARAASERAQLDPDRFERMARLTRMRMAAR